MKWHTIQFIYIYRFSFDCEISEICQVSKWSIKYNLSIIEILLGFYCTSVNVEFITHQTIRLHSCFHQWQIKAAP